MGSHAPPAPLERPPTDPPKILVARLSSIGDVVRTVPAVRALRQALPTARIDWLVEDRYADLIEGLADLTRLQVVPRDAWRRLPAARRVAAVRAFVGTLRAERYDIYLDFHGVFKSAMYGVLAGIPRRVGFPGGLSRELNSLFSTEHVTAPAGPLSRYRKNLLLVRRLDGGASLERTGLPLTPDDRAFAESLMAAHALRPRAFVAVHPGSSARGRLKRWLPERYAEVCDRLHTRHGLPTVVVWGPGDESLAATIAARASSRPLVSPATTPRQAAAVIASAVVFIGGDTGFLHVASLVGTPLVAIFGPSDPVVNAPADFTPYRIVRGNVDCSACRRSGCPNRECMTAVTVEMVAEAAADLAAASPHSSTRSGTS